MKYVASLVALLLATAVVPGAQQPARYDLLIKNGRVFDGTGNPWFPADIAVQDGRIVSQGITTVVVNQDGRSPWPVAEQRVLLEKTGTFRGHRLRLHQRHRHGPTPAS